MPDFSSALDKTFKVSNVKEPLTLTIVKVALEEVGFEKEMLPVAEFTEDRRKLVLGAGRYNAIAEAVGSRNTDDWEGVKIVLKVDPNIRFKGKKTGGLVVSVVTEEAAQ